MIWGKAEFERYYRFRPERGLGGRFTPRGQTPRPYIYLHYHDYFVGTMQSTEQALAYFNLLSMAVGDSVLIVGAGFNYTAEGLTTLGVDVAGLDTSDYILAEKDETEEAELRECIIRAGLDPDTHTIPATDEMVSRGLAGKNFLDYIIRGTLAAPKARGFGTIAAEDGGTTRSVNAIARLLPSSIRFIITEETLNSVDDATAVLICQAADRIKVNKSPNATIVHALSPRQIGFDQAPELNWKTYAEWRTFLDANGFSTHKIIPTVGTAETSGYGVLL